MTIESLIPYIPTLIVGASFLTTSIVGGTIAFVKGIFSKKTTKNLTETQQKEDLYQEMIDQIKSTEQFSVFLKNSMTKQQLSNWKKNEVLKNVSLYAASNGYGWFVRNEWEEKIVCYITDANVASGKNDGSAATQVANNQTDTKGFIV